MEKIYKGPARTILVVDDSLTTLEVMRSFLKEEGYKVVPAKDAIEGIKKTYRYSPDLVIMDVEMPLMKGYQACRYLKARPQTAHIPVILFTVRKEKDDVIWGRESGADDLVPKDDGFLSEETKKELLSKIRSFLNGKESKAIDLAPPSDLEILSGVSEILDDVLRRTVFLSRRISWLFDLSKELLVIEDLPVLYQRVMEAAVELMDADSGSLMFLNPWKNSLTIVAQRGLKIDLTKYREIVLGERIAGWVAKNRQPILLIGAPGARKEFSGLKPREEIASSISVPLLVKGELKGVLNLNRLHPKKDFTKEDLYFCGTMANYLAGVIEKEKYSEELKASLKKLEAAEAQLIESEKMASLGYFASGMAHEIRNPLTAISGEAQYLSAKYNDDSEEKKALKVIIRQSERISDIIERLLSFSRGKTDRDDEPLDVKGLVDDVLGLIQYQINLNRIEVSRNIPDGLPPVRGPKTQIEEIFLNIIVNAHQSMPDGGKIDISASDDGGFVKINIKDTGSGIKEEDKRYVFHPFFSRKASGTGLGLFISKQIADSIGGTISFYSVQGRGTSFIVRLPVYHPAAQAG